MPSITGCPRRLILLPAPLRKYTQVATELQTSCNQVVVKLISGLFPIVVPSLEQVVLILLQGNKLDKLSSTRLTTVTSLLQVVLTRLFVTCGYALVDVNLLTSCTLHCVQTISNLSEQLVASLLASTYQQIATSSAC